MNVGHSFMTDENEWLNPPSQSFSVFSGGSFVGQAEASWTSPPTPVPSNKSQRPRWSFEADIIAHDCFSSAVSVETTLCWSPVWLRSLTTSSCWIKSSVSTLAGCQQRSARAACLWKHNSLPSSLSYSNKEEHYRERRLTSVWSFQR